MSERDQVVDEIREYIREQGYVNALTIAAKFAARGAFYFKVVRPDDVLDRVPCDDIKVVEYTNRAVENIPRFKDLFYYDPREKE